MNNISIVTYHYGNGCNVSAAKSEDGALRIGASIARERCQDGMWSEEDVARFKALADDDYTGVIALFEEFEAKLYDGETIEITQTALVD